MAHDPRNDPNTLVPEGHLGFEALPGLQAAFAAGIRQGILRWTLDLSRTTGISAAPAAPLVAMAGGVRSFGGEFAVASPPRAVRDGLIELGLAPLFPATDAAGIRSHQDKPPDRAEMEERLLVYRNGRRTTRILRKDVPILVGTEVVLPDERGQYHSARIARGAGPTGGEEVVLSAPDFLGKAGTPAAGTLLSFRIQGAVDVFETQGAPVLWVEGGRISLGAPPIFTKSPKRLHERYIVDLPCRFLPADLSAPGETGVGRVVNLSLGGCLLSTPGRVLKPGGLLSLSLSGERFPIELAGKVIRARGTYFVIAFLEPGESGAQSIERLLARAQPAT